MESSRDISDRVHRMLLSVAGLSWVCFLLSFLSLDHWAMGFSAGNLSAALIGSWTAAGASIWASLRTRNRGCYLAALVSIPLTQLCGLRLYVLLGFMGALE